ncbi:MAG: prepilin-type N-terminal cleavage/methylation domain-containing protein [Candidatus Niyogibacteria bacterium]|nr:prepilin-type N-terminal cleavage/methylation domain-containing protein [Candidatus Niyogibacteria bacterium]
MSYKSSVKKGFTLLELLIVISIIAILSLILIFALNPAEILRKARDTQRVSDLNTIKTALAVYITSTSTPLIGGRVSNMVCKQGIGAGTWYTTGPAAGNIFYSYPGASTITGANEGTALTASTTSSANLNNIDGTGWIPVNFETLTAGSPISNLPIDPTNSIANLAAPVNTDLVYRYACNASSTTFEIDAQLESNEYTVQNDLRAKDGGNHSTLYEQGTNLKILGGSVNTF